MARYTAIRNPDGTYNITALMGNSKNVQHREVQFRVPLRDLAATTKAMAERVQIIRKGNIATRAGVGSTTEES